MISQFVLTFSVLSSGVLGASLIPPGLIPMLDGRIVGGQMTRIENFPHQVSMRYLGNHRCGGSIIGQKIILSAAHCVDSVRTAFLSIRAGITDRDQTGVESLVSRVIIHGQWNRQTMDNDIAVIHLTREYQYSPRIQPIQMPGGVDNTFAGRSATVSGWGATREGGSGSNTLQFVDLSIISQAECSRAYSGGNIKITETMICAGNNSGGKDACQGDSGGPLIVYNAANEAQLIGVVSWGFGCARPDYPGVYSRISVLRRWIDESIRVLKNSP